MKNEYEINGDTVVLHLYRKNGEHIETYTSLEDLPKLQAWENSWYLNDRRTICGDCRVVSTVYRPAKATVKLHRYILGVTDPNIKVDHIDGNPLNNRRQNLRTATVSQNSQNRGSANSNSKSGVRGVYWSKPHACWRAAIMVSGRLHHLGLYDDLLEADAVVKKARAEMMPYSKEARETA